MMRLRRSGLLLGGCLTMLLTGCTAHSAPPMVGASGPESGASRASRLAEELVAAETAFDAGDDKALVAVLTRINRRSARPLDADAIDPVMLWRDRVRGAVPPLRGRALGPGYVCGTLAPGAATSLMQLFLSGQPATIAADSKPSQDLRLVIFDADGKPVCDRRPVRGRDCRFTPVFTQRYRIELSNGGASKADYYLVVD